MVLTLHEARFDGREEAEVALRAAMRMRDTDTIRAAVHYLMTLAEVEAEAILRRSFDVANSIIASAGEEAHEAVRVGREAASASLEKRRLEIEAAIDEESGL